MATPKVTTPRRLVVVTGGSGYIAGYCIAQVLNEGWCARTNSQEPWGCRGSARDYRRGHGDMPAQSSSWRPISIQMLAGPMRSRGLTMCSMSRLRVPTVDPKSDDELVRPARDGTLRVLKAARDAGVKRVVMTSSISAIMFGRGVREKPFAEADWTARRTATTLSPYDRAKTIAERAAWAWHKDEGGGLELVTVNPGLVLGPVLGSDFRRRLRRSGSCWTVRSRPYRISASTWSTCATSRHCNCWR